MPRTARTLQYKSNDSQGSAAVLWRCMAPPYISDLIHIYTPARALRSEGWFQLVVPKTRLKTRGDRAFSVVWPRVWNALPLHVRTAPTVECFKSRLKTHFYSLAFNTAWVVWSSVFYFFIILIILSHLFCVLKLLFMFFLRVFMYF